MKIIILFAIVIVLEGTPLVSSDESIPAVEPRTKVYWRQRIEGLDEQNHTFSTKLMCLEIFSGSGPPNYSYATWLAPEEKAFIESFIKHIHFNKNAEEFNASVLESLDTYAKVSNMSRLLLASALARQPLFGTREGKDTLKKTAAEVEAFREKIINSQPTLDFGERIFLSDELELWQSRLRESQLGDPVTLRRLQDAYFRGEVQLEWQKTSVRIIGIVILLIAVSIPLALVLRRRNANKTTLSLSD
jgi:hypothetical protein